MARNKGERQLTKQAYKLRLEGLSEAEGHINANTLVRALGALLGTAERATRLAATGRSVARGRKPAWLKAAMDFTVTGLGTGSTILDIRAPRLGDVLHEDFAQQDFWLQQPDVQDTALDLGARAIAEAQNSRASGEHYDTSVLKEILGLGRAAETARRSLRVASRESSATGVRSRGDGLCRPRVIEACRISAWAEGDAIFERIPDADMIGREAPIKRPSVTALRHVDPMVLWGTWPGDEPIEELLAELD